jgi:hypothetical protein
MWVPLLTLQTSKRYSFNFLSHSTKNIISERCSSFPDSLFLKDYIFINFSHCEQFKDVEVIVCYSEFSQEIRANHAISGQLGFPSLSAVYPNDEF